MAVRSNNFPSSEVKEIDLSTGAVVDSGSMHLIVGFTNKGQLYTPVKVYTIGQYVNVFGEPLTDAEFYVYTAVSRVLDNGGTPIVVRIPYDNEASKNYNGLALTIAGSGFAPSAIDTNVTDTATRKFLAAAGLKGFTKFWEMTAGVATVTNAQLALIASNGDFSGIPDISGANFFISDKNKSTCIDEDFHGGLFVVVFDPLRAMLVQRLLDTGVAADDNAMLTAGIGLVKKIVPLGSQDAIGDWSIDLDGSIIHVDDDVRNYAPDSLSRQIANLFPGFDSSIVSNSVQVDKTYSNYVGIAVCMVTKSDSAVSVNTPTIIESFVGSIAPVRNASTGVSEYIVDVVNGGSSYVTMIANRLNQTEDGQTTVSGGTMKALPVKAGEDALLFCGGDAGSPSAVSLTSFPYGSNDKVIKGSTVGANLVTALSKVSDVDDVQVDVVVDAGLSSVAQFTSSTGGEYYQPDFDIDAANGEITGASSISVWTSVVNALDAFCSGTRKDCMALIDAPRNATLRGSSPIVNDLDPSATFANNVEQGFTAVSSALNSSYSAIYSNWTKRNNPYTGTDVWVPPSCEVAGLCARCDVTYNPWNSPAFLERGVLSGVAGLSLYPGKEEESFLYPKSLNYVKYFNAEGYVVWGQKTTQKKEGAFSRINVRRNALRIERHLYQVGRQFIGKGNTVYNRRQWIDLVTPYLSNIKNSDGIYDFYLVCDETNNTPAVIDANEFRAAAFIKFVREGEFVVTSVVATNTSANFQEVVGVANI